MESGNWFRDLHIVVVLSLILVWMFVWELIGAFGFETRENVCWRKREEIGIFSSIIRRCLIENFGVLKHVIHLFRYESGHIRQRKRLRTGAFTPTLDGKQLEIILRADCPSFDVVQLAKFI